MKDVYRKMIISLLLLMISISGVWCAAVNKRTVTAMFTAPQTCYVGFSRKKVVNNVRLRPNELYQSATIDGVTNEVNSSAVQFKFYPTDPIVSSKPSQKGVYYSDEFYAYCQVSSTDTLKVTLSVPSKMSSYPSGSGADLAFEFIDLASMQQGLLAGTWKPWTKATGVDTKSLVFEEVNGHGEHRVVMSQPIFLRVDGADFNKASGKNTKYYSLTFAIKVETV